MMSVVLQSVGAMPLVALVVLLLAIVTVYKSVVIVDATEKRAYTRFGEYRGLLEPGFGSRCRGA